MSTGRNDPCPCGSGKKYKICCAAKVPNHPVKRNLPSDNFNTALYFPKALELFRSGQYEQASALCQKILKFQPNHTLTLDLLGGVYCELKKYSDAAECFSRAINLDGLNPDYHNHLGIAFKSTGLFPKAEECFKNALKLDPHHPEALNNLGNTLKWFGKISEAECCYREAIKHHPQFSGTYFNLSTLMEEMAKWDEAMACYQLVLKDNPKDDETWGRLGNALQQLERVDEALDCYRRALDLNPKNLAAYLHSLLLTSEQNNCELINKLESFLARGSDLNNNNGIRLLFSLGNLHDQEGNFDTAFGYYTQANRLQRALLDKMGVTYDHGTFVEYIDRLIAIFCVERFARRLSKGNPSTLPVFIVGMPRSGTTLVEQILASHPQIHGAGELFEIPRMMQMYINPSPVTSALRGDIALPDEEMSTLIAKQYLEFVSTLAPHAQHVTDKMPDNVLGLGLIAWLLPRARIILCRRDLRDTCLSCYFQNFLYGQPFSTDLAECTKRHLEVDRLVRHWKAVLPSPILEIHYERLVNNIEEESKRMVEFLELGWEPACLDFHRTERTVRTASKLQVRQPLYQSSVGRWRHYEKHLQPMLDVLEQAGPLPG